MNVLASGDHDDDTGSSDGGLVDLPSVVHDYPAAVLLVDTTSSEILFVNDLARQLAPAVKDLPVPVADWSQAAGLHVVGGGPLEASETPLARIALGQPRTGREVNAELGSEASEAREALWVVGLPLDSAPEPLRRRALLVMLPLRFPEAVSEMKDAASIAQAHRSVVTSDLAMAISDPHQEDDPLIWVNAGFERVTGYAAADVLGRNCRFMQGPDTDPDDVARLGEALRQNLPVSETLLNYRKDGSAFYNHLLITPVHDAEGRLTHHVSVQSDVTQRILAQREGNAARREAVEARRAQSAAEEAGDFGRLLLHLSEALTATETVDDVAATIADLAGRELGATSSGLALVDEFRGHLEFITMDHLPPGTDQSWRRVALSEDVPTAVVARTGRMALHADRQEVLNSYLGLKVHAPLPAMGASAFLPLQIADQVLGVMVLLWDGPRRMGEQENAGLGALARYTSQALQRAILLAERRTAAQILQESLLTHLPTVDRLELSARYVPAAARDQVGGDWYDAIYLPDGRTALVIGDVVGHDIQAAAYMGQLRSLLRAFVYDRAEQPSQLVSRLDRTIDGLRVEGLATLVLAVLADNADGSQTLTWSTAGHPPPIVLLPDGTTKLLDGAPDPPVGIFPDRVRQDHQRTVPPGSTVLFYTDGLIERRGRLLSVGVQQVRDLLESQHHLPLEEQLDQLVTDLVGADPGDDCALLAVRVRRPAGQKGLPPVTGMMAPVV